MIQDFYLSLFLPSNRTIKSNQYKSAFTLAEVLITIGIIGVLAVLTLPSLISHHKMIESVNRLKKTYSVLNQVYKMGELDYGEIENWDWNLSTKDFFNKYFVPYLSITENCEVNQTSACWNDSGTIYYLNGNDSRQVIKSNSYAKVKLVDGTLLAFQNQSEHAHFYIDTNGKRRPNMYGKDIFVVTITKGVFKENNRHDISHAGLWLYGTGMSLDVMKSNCKNNSEGLLCAAYLYFNNWQIPQDYPRY